MAEPEIDTAALERIDAVPVLRHPRRSIEVLPGGADHQNFRVSTPDGVYVARLAGQSSELLAIDRRAEYFNAAAAAATGVGPRIIDFREDVGVMVVEWLDGRTMGPADVRDPALIPLVVQACRRLHTARPFAADFDMFALQRRYLATVRRLGLPLPDRYAEFGPQIDQVERALSISPPKAVPCHNDLLAENFILTGAGVRIIDFEYSGNNDPCFELGNIASESSLPDDGLRLLLSTYFGRSDERLYARAQPQALMSQYGWTLWGIIQSAVGQPNFDFREWALAKYDRAVVTLTGASFRDLLEAAATPVLS